MKDEVQGIYSASLFAEDLAGMVYKQLKGKMFTFLEMHFEGVKLAACKRMVEGGISTTAKDVHDYAVGVLGDWEIEVTAGGELTPNELTEAIKEREEIKAVIK